MVPSLRLDAGRRRRRLAAVMAAAAAFALGALHTAPARAQGQELWPEDDAAPKPALTAEDFTLSLWSSSAGVGADAVEVAGARLARFFSARRCLCPTNLIALVEASAAGRGKIAGRMVEAELVLGPSCTSPAEGCAAAGARVALDAATGQGAVAFRTDIVFAAISGASESTCAALGEGETTLWARLRVDGVPLAQPLALSIPYGAAAPSPPSGVEALPADGGLLVSWKAPAGAVAAYQVLCLPRPARAAPPAFERCDAEIPPPVVGGGISADAALVCSAAVAAPAASVRLTGLANGTAYEVAVVSIDAAGAVSAPSPIAVGTPSPTLDFYDHYRRAGGGAAVGCSAGGGGGGTLSLLAVGAALALAFRRRAARGRAARGLAAVALLSAPLPARAQGPVHTTHDGLRGEAPRASTRSWDLSLRFGPYRPGIDDELIDAGSAARPFAETFSARRRLITRTELAYHLSHAFGTLALGGGVGYYRATGAAWAAEGADRSGDETTLQIVPLSVSLTFRADRLPWVETLPLVPYVKGGLLGAVWQSRRSGAGAPHRGFTPGWHAAVGLALRLDFLDAGAARALDDELGLNGIAVFVEWDRAALDGLGLAGRLRLGDSIWAAGLLLEL